MPEAPELLESRNQLREVILNNHVSKFECTEMGRYSVKAPVGFAEADKLIQLEPFRVTEIDVHGKFMWWKFSSLNTSFYMHCTYGMSGQWRSLWSVDDDRLKHVAFVINIRKGLIAETCYGFVDQRRFGTIKFVFDETEHQKKLKTLAPSVYDPKFDFKTFLARVKKHPKKTTAELLMSQTAAVAGIGNYLKAEILYASRISPHRLVKDLTDDEIQYIWNNMLSIANNAYAWGGATIRTYSNPNGTLGKFKFEMACYGLKEDRLGRKIIKEETLDKRTTHWCPEIQK